jgi:hypothetical protein
VELCVSWRQKQVARGAAVAILKKAILSFRLRLHSGLRQSGSAFGVIGFMGLRPMLVWRRAFSAR